MSILNLFSDFFNLFSRIDFYLLLHHFLFLDLDQMSDPRLLQAVQEYLRILRWMLLVECLFRYQINLAVSDIFTPLIIIT